MSIYPLGYPDQRLIVGGVDLTVEFNIVLIDGFELNPPEPKIYTVDIPGGNGVIDLTESLGGDVAYNNREQRFTFKSIYPTNFEDTKRDISNMIHGKFFEYKLSWDPDYTYKGRFTIESYSHVGLAAGQLGEIVIRVSADPYKYLPTKVYKINGSGGSKFYLPSGRKPVHPVIETARATNITYKGKTTRVGIGTFRLNDILFQQGTNEIYINTFNVLDTKWEDISPGGSHAMTWSEASEYIWDELQRLTLEDGTPATNPQTIATLAAIDDTGEKKVFIKAYRWGDLMNDTWQSIYDRGWTWDGLNSDAGAGTGSELGGEYGAIITYEWGDL